MHDDLLSWGDILTAPVRALFSVTLYRKVLKSPAGKGILYLLYFSLLVAVIATLAFTFVAIPAGTEFVGWLKGNLPEMRFTRDGLVTQVSQPFTLTHPKAGTILVIDTREQDPTLEKMPDTFFYLTKTKAVIRGGNRQETRVLDLIPKTADAQKNFEEFTLTGPVLETFYKKSLPYITALVAVLTMVVFFLWKLLASLLYSLIALI